MAFHRKKTNGIDLDRICYRKTKAVERVHFGRDGPPQLCARDFFGKPAKSWRQKEITWSKKEVLGMAVVWDLGQGGRAFLGMVYTLSSVGGKLPQLG